MSRQPGSSEGYEGGGSPEGGEMDMDMEPGGVMEPGGIEAPAAASSSYVTHSIGTSHASSGQHQTNSAASIASAAAGRSHWPTPTLYGFLLNTSLNSILASFLATRDLFFLQFLNRGCFTLLNSNANLLKIYYQTTRLHSFIPFMVDDYFCSSFLTPIYLKLPDGSLAVRNTYSLHCTEIELNFCSRISNKTLEIIALNIGVKLKRINLEGGGRSRINEYGMRTLFHTCTNIESLNLNGHYQLNMVETLSILMNSCKNTITDLSLNGCAQLNDQALGLLTQAKLRRLYLTSTPVTDLSLQTLASSFKENLEILHIGYCGNVTDRGIAALVNYCRFIQDLNLYGCTGLSRHALSYLRLCPLLHTIDISRIHSLDDSSIVEWILPTNLLQEQQKNISRNINSNNNNNIHGNNSSSHPDYNPNLPQIFAAQNLNPILEQKERASLLLINISLDNCSRITALGLKVLIENCPSLTYLNSFGIQNLNLFALQSLLRIVDLMKHPLKRMEIGGGCIATLNPNEIEQLRKEFSKIQL